MLALLFSYQNNLRAASFVGIDRAPAGARGGNRILLKKVLDVVIATIAIALSAPLMLCVALAINLESRGPINFRRKTTGLNGSIFEIWKFSMNVQISRSGCCATDKQGRSEGNTGGRVIRRSSNADLPRWLNVFQDRMAVAGPRTHALDTPCGRTTSRRLRRPPPY
jgi:putative colanic acid biosynthesis UDP-glucose lipid carrier transferase